MAKPLGISIRNLLFKKVSEELMISESIVEAVVMNQFEGAIQAMKTKHTMELSGFGRMMFNHKRALGKKLLYSRLDKIQKDLLAQDITPAKRRSVEGKQAMLFKNVEGLTPLLRET